MADLVICYAKDGEATAGRLAGAAAAEGYTVWSEGRGSSITDRISDVRAAIVIWSELSRSSDWIRAEANYARGQKKLIQASIDGGPPPRPFSPDTVTSMAGWTGEEAHPGWRRIRAGLEALCGPPPARQDAAAAHIAATRPAAPAPAIRRRRGWLVAPLTLALLAAVALATFAWMRGLAPVSRQGQAVPTATTADPVRPVPAAGPPETAPADLPPPEAAPPEPAPREAEAQPPARSPTGPRINRRNAENMRLFCERAGRGTPQCRTFARQLRNQRR